MNIGGNSGWSEGGSQSDGYSWGTSSSYGYNVGGSESNAYSQAYSYDIGENWSNANSYGEQSGWNTVYGREASAQDIQNAREANLLQRGLWDAQAEYNAKEAEKNRDWQAYMSNTAYQRAVADLLLAGLNPILAVGNMGASTPTGGMASSGLASAHKANAYAQSEGRNHGYNTSQSSSYGYNKGESNSYSESKSRSWNQSENWSDSQNYSENHSTSWERSETTNNIKELAEAITGLGTIAIEQMGSIGKVGDLFGSPSSGRSSWDYNLKNTYKQLFGKGGTNYHYGSSGKRHGGRAGSF